ncbi:MAG: hypothetical protein MRY63_02540 [Neomegalonema sp.]|nr:hypothetical protein [Neomegalonema sp.]
MQLIELTKIAADYPAAPYAAAALAGAVATLAAASLTRRRRSSEKPMLERSAWCVLAVAMGAISAALNGAGGYGMLSELPSGLVIAACALLGMLVPIGMLAARSRAFLLAAICYSLSIYMNVVGWYAMLQSSDIALAHSIEQAASLEASAASSVEAESNARADQAAMRLAVETAGTALTIASQTARDAQAALTAHGSEPAIARQLAAMRADLATAEAALECELNGPIGCTGAGGMPINEAGAGPKSRALAATITELKTRIAELGPDLATATRAHTERAAELTAHAARAGEALASAQAAMREAQAALGTARSDATAARQTAVAAIEGKAELAQQWPSLIATARAETSANTRLGRALGITIADVIMMLSILLALAPDLCSAHYGYSRAAATARKWRGIAGEASLALRWIWHGDSAPAQPKPEITQIEAHTPSTPIAQAPATPAAPAEPAASPDAAQPAPAPSDPSAELELEATKAKTKALEDQIAALTAQLAARTAPAALTLDDALDAGENWIDAAPAAASDGWNIERDIINEKGARPSGARPITPTEIQDGRLITARDHRNSLERVLMAGAHPRQWAIPRQNKLTGHGLSAQDANRIAWDEHRSIRQFVARAEAALSAEGETPEDAAAAAWKAWRHHAEAIDAEIEARVSTGTPYLRALADSWSEWRQEHESENAIATDPAEIGEIKKDTAA